MEEERTRGREDGMEAGEKTWGQEGEMENKGGGLGCLQRSLMFLDVLLNIFIVLQSI